MLRPIVDLIEIPLEQLEMIMARAEKLDRKWSDEAALHSTRPRLYRYRNSEQREPLTVMGDYIVFRMFKRRYQWISRHDVAEENIVLENVVPDGMVYMRHYMDRASGVFYLTYCPESTKDPV
jgi:hypothetical protein